MNGSKSFWYNWIEQYLFFPNALQQLISIAVLPLTVVYCVITAYKRTQARVIDFGIDIISIGNIIVGGSGKTPITIALANYIYKNNLRKNITVILRGYGRKSQGLYIVSKKGKILEDVNIAGDEALLLANSLKFATVIVSENRDKAIIEAKKLNSDLVLLDDGYSKHHIKKFDILVRPKKEPQNIFCLPSGGYRETKMIYSFVDMVLKEDEDFTRDVCYKHKDQKIDTLPNNTILLTAISKPYRLLEFLPKDIKVVSFEDHYYFTQNDINNIQTKYPNYDIIVTQKDFVKLQQLQIYNNIYILDLDIKINDEKLEKIKLLLKDDDATKED